MRLRLSLLVALLLGLDRLAPAQDATRVVDPIHATVRGDDPTRWYDIRLLGVEGQGWPESVLKAPFDRLPGKAEGQVRDAVWGLSRHSAGLAVRFVTDAPSLRARWTLTSDRLAMAHMPATGVSGVDLYARVDGRWHWLAVGQPQAGTTHTVTLASTLPEGERAYLLYLPLYNGVSAVEIGVPPGARLSLAPPRSAEHQKPIVVYGTSITQGGCASRPGMVHTAILGRRFDRPVINLGFSGNGLMEPELANLLAELEAAVYVLDCLPNMSAAQVAERVAPFVRRLRQSHPTTPIVLAEDRTYADAVLIDAHRQRNADSRAALRKAFDTLVADGVPGLHYLPGGTQLGADGEDTVDGSHPTDLGFLRMADAFEPVLRPLVNPAPTR